MTWKNDLIKQLKLHEGFRSKPYQCTANVWTIGFGSTSYIDGTKVTKDDKPISENDALSLLTNYLNQNVYPKVYKFFPDFDNFTNARKVAICDMLYNLGEQRFSLFKATIAAINSARWTDAGRHAENSKWAKQVGKRASKIASQLRNG